MGNPVIFVLGLEVSSDRNTVETGSLITMTSDERVQIFVPSPAGGGTPYSTITKSSNQEFLQAHKHQSQVPWSNANVIRIAILKRPYAESTQVQMKGYNKTKECNL